MGKRQPAFKKRSDSSSQQRLHEPLVFFLDRCLQSEIIIAALLAAGLEVRLHRDFFPDDAPDTDWLPEVAGKRWILLTKDERIRRRPLEKQCLLIPGARSFILTSGNMTGQEMADTFIRWIGRISAIAKNEPTPFIAAVTKDGVRLLCSEAQGRPSP
jgi:hypothetical protein